MWGQLLCGNNNSNRIWYPKGWWHYYKENTKYVEWALGLGSSKNLEGP